MAHNLLNTSWTSHRLSPLHHGHDFPSLLDNQRALDTYAARLRDHLTTTSLADSQGAGWGPETATTNANVTGALKTCTWETLRTLSFEEESSSEENENENENPNPAGILITLLYSDITTTTTTTTTTVYKAILLGPSNPPKQNSTKAKAKSKKEEKPPTSTTLPLLLTRLPKPLRECLISFLSSTFDTYCSSLRLPSRFLVEVLETYVHSLSSSSTSTSFSASEMIEDLLRELHLTISFAPPIAPSLKGVNVSIPREALGGFLFGEGDQGQGRKEGSSSSSSSVLSGVEMYLQRHLAMDLSLSGGSGGGSSLAGGYVRLSRVACAGFVVTGEGRVKLVGPSQGQSGRQEGEDNGDQRRERNRAVLRASEALLRAVLQRAVVGID